ncbi:MAG: adenine phosphoribosyltransferase [Candidatus Woesearchaeota archaeon]
MKVEELKKYIRNIPDFPKKGIIFRDITPLLKNPSAFNYVINSFAKELKSKKVDFVVSAEARGFILGAALAYKLKAGFIPLRKPGKLPYKTIRHSFKTEYSIDAFEIHSDALKKGSRVVIVDDVLATGGTASAAVKLVKKLGAKVLGVLFLIELEALKGREKLKGENVFSLIKY